MSITIRKICIDCMHVLPSTTSYFHMHVNMHACIKLYIMPIAHTLHKCMHDQCMHDHCVPHPKCMSVLMYSELCYRIGRESNKIMEKLPAKKLELCSFSHSCFYACMLLLFARPILSFHIIYSRVSYRGPV